MDAARKSYEVQSQVRQNAEVLKKTLNGIFEWEKEIKEKEKTMKEKYKVLEKEENERLKTLPVRTDLVNQQVNKQKEIKLMGDPEQEDAQTPTEIPIGATTDVDPYEIKHVEANFIKDRGNKFVKSGDYEKAIEAYTTAIEIFPDDAAFFNNRALCYLRLLKYDDCIEDCERAISIDDLSVKSYYRRMQANEALGNDTEALKDCNAVLTIEPKNIDAKKSLERIKEKLKKIETIPIEPCFSLTGDDFIDISPIEKPPHKRSNKPLRRIPISDIIEPKHNKNYENTSMKISDEDIDKLFNSNCGPFVEIKKDVKTSNKVLNKIEKTTKSIPSEATLNPSVKINDKESMKKATEKPARVDDEELLANSVQNKKTVQTTNTIKEIEESQTIEKRPLPPAPITTAQFYSNWKELSKAQKYQYLKAIPQGSLSKILGAGFDSETLYDVLQIINEFYVPNNETTIASTLLEISKNNQIKILSLLMSREEHEIISKIVNGLKQEKQNVEMAEKIAKNFNID